MVGKHWQKLNLVLLIHFAIEHEITHFGMTIFYLSTRLGDIEHTFCSELIGFGIGSRLMVAVLVDGGIAAIIVEDDIIFQFAHSVELHPRHLSERTTGLRQRVFRRTFQQGTIFVEERAKHAQRGNFCKGVEEGCGEARQHIEVTAARLHKGKEAAAIHPLATSENRFEILSVGNDEIEGFQFAITSRVHKIHHPYAIFLCIAYDVCFREFSRWFTEIGHHRIGGHAK